MVHICKVKESGLFLTFSCKIDKDSTKCQKGMGALCIDIHISYF